VTSDARPGARGGVPPGDPLAYEEPDIIGAVTDQPPVPLFDLELSPEDIAAVVETLRSGWLTMGPRIEALEQAFAAYVGTRHAVAVANGTAALHLAHLAAGVGPGDEVILPSFTFVATANAALYCGATPVFADIVGPERPSIDPAEVLRLLTPRTRAVVAVHFGGYAAEIDELATLCRDRGLALIEDVAHAPGADYGGRRLGGFGVAGAFSFFSNKVLPVGEGGMVTTDDDDLAAGARRLRSHAMTSVTWDRHRGHADSYDVVGLGFNYRLDEPRAALAMARLARIDQEIARRRELTLVYRKRLSRLDGVLIPYAEEDVAHSACYVMPIMLRDPERRAALRRTLRERHGVQTSILYPAIHEFSAFRERFPGVSLPRTEHAARAEVTIPLYPHMTTTDQERVLAGLEEALDA
jgi:dTDP-4-amino-4,6-dideoxygalactose transaminase